VAQPLQSIGGMNDVRILDCTLRDGGYYTGWQFSRELARDVVAALDAAGVDIIELGYRCPRPSPRDGAFRTCDEELIAQVAGGRRRAALAFMLDTKEYVTAGAIDRRALAATIGWASSSQFSWARVATHPDTIAQTMAIADWLRERGYRVAVNLMGASMLDDARLAQLVDAAGAAPLDALYLADSHGSLTPARTGELIDRVRDAYGGPIGVHLHENLGLSMANAMVALERGVEYVDATLAGMGRGAGNLRTELFLLALRQYERRTDLHPEALLPSLAAHMQPLLTEHRWGCDFAYMTGALAGMHPSYVQELKARGHHTLGDIAAILADIPAGKRRGFDYAELRAAEERHQGRRAA